MRKSRYFLFETFRLDVLDERLWDREKSVRLGHKALAVLRRLLSQPGELVTKDDLMTAAWPDTVVCEAVLTTAMRELRRALGDQARLPRFIETVHGRGYRFIASVTETSVPELPTNPAPPRIQSSALSRFPSRRFAYSGCLVGRDAEWAQLQEWYATALRGERRIGFIAGAAGIGKTTLVEAFVSEVAARGKARVSHGQCIRHYGVGEAYLPILEALGRLGRDGGAPIVALLREYAPNWLKHLPLLTPGEEFDALTSVTSEKMLRELADALEILTERDALILVLEDLHWCDTATLELLAYISRRRDPARLLVLCAYRPVETSLNNQPLRSLIAELRSHPQCPEIAIDCLSGESVQDYVLQRCGPIPRLKEITEALHRRTGGHPLFLSAIVSELMRRKIPKSADEPEFVDAPLQAIANVIPASVHQFIEHRFEELSSDEQAILEAASVAGHSFSAAAVVAATFLPEEKIEARCAAWAREGQFLAAEGLESWPDGTLAARYGFRHDLFQEVAYARISPERRAHFHRQIGTRLEKAYGKRAATVAAELAMHFDRGRNPQTAGLYLAQAARNALQRSAYSEAGRHLTRGQELLEAIPEGLERLRMELALSLLLGHTLQKTSGWAVEDVERLYERARELSEEITDTASLLEALWGLIGVNYVRAEFRKTQSLARDVLAIAEKRRDPIYRVLGHMELGGLAFAFGEPVSATEHFQKADAIYKPNQSRSHVGCFGADLGLFSRSWATHFLWQKGYPDQARASAEETLNLARKLAHPFTQTITLAYAAMLNQLRRDVEETGRLAEATIAYSTEHGFSYYLAWAKALQGWTRAALGDHERGLAGISGGIEALQSTAGARLPYYRALLAEAYGWAGRIDQALKALDDAFADVGKTGERWWEAELYRLRGELFRSEAINRRNTAEDCFRTAIEVARGQQAKSIELRAAVSLCRLWRDEGKRTQARQLLAEVHDWFTEGFDTPDLRDARSLLEELTF
ncbi:MAG TPA: AAA family ATPase [Blastocatellia bacterium]|nr:AAA family ATPase [Blastocatellia bacterium]